MIAMMLIAPAARAATTPVATPSPTPASDDATRRLDAAATRAAAGIFGMVITETLKSVQKAGR